MEDKEKQPPAPPPSQEVELMALANGRDVAPAYIPTPPEKTEKPESKK